MTSLDAEVVIAVAGDEVKLVVSDDDDPLKGAAVIEWVVDAGLAVEHCSATYFSTASRTLVDEPVEEGVSNGFVGEGFASDVSAEGFFVVESEAAALDTSGSAVEDRVVVDDFKGDTAADSFAVTGSTAVVGATDDKVEEDP